MGKKGKGKSGGDFWDEDPELESQATGSVEFDGAQPPAENTDAAASPEPTKLPEQGNLDEEFNSGGLLGALKRSKKKKDDKAQEEIDAAAAAKDASAVKVKSKKEKEKEKKEKEKAKKKAQQAARKAAGQAAKENSVSASASPAPESGSGEKGAEEQGKDAGEEDAAALDTKSSAAKGKKKKLNPALAALQKQMAARKAAEDARLAEEEEEKRLLEEESKREAEEEEAREAARQAKREKDKKKKDELRAQGKLLTKKQKEQKAQLARRREQLLASGMLIPGVNGDVKPQTTANTQSRGASKESSPAPKASKPKVEEDTVKTVSDKVETLKVSESTAKDEVNDTNNGSEADEEVDEEEEPLMDDWEAALTGSEGEVEEETDTSPTPEIEKTSTKDTTSESKPATATQSSPDSAASGEDWKKFDAKKRQEVSKAREARHKKAVAGADAGDLRSPICAILGHVDTGKTKLLDNMRKTNVQEGEAGGITQQIGATYFPIEMIEKKTEVMVKYAQPQYHVPGLLIIDTPGHESFSNLRSRGSSLCNIAILVVDIMHGLEQQTLESIRLLRDRKTPFVVALNKIDRLYGWKSTTNNSFRDSLAAQDSAVQREFEDRLEKTKLLFAEQGFNSEVYYKNKNMSKYVSIVPTSAVTGEGVPDLLYLLLELTQSRMSKQLMYLSQLEATVLEVKVVEGLGTTIDVVLSNGVLHEGDRIVLCGMNGPIATNVRALLTPQPARELRIKSQYVHHKEVKAALGVKIAANDLDQAIAGSRLLLVGPNDDEEDLMDDVMDDMTGLLDSVDKNGEGVCVQASTLGSLEALLDFLKDMKIPVMSIGLGPVYKRDVMRATTMLDKNKEFAVMLCFDVKVDKEAQQYADEQGIKIFQADIIYHLFDEFTNYQKQLLEQRRKDNQHDAVFPVVLRTIQIINKRNPMIIGVDIIEGSLRIGTPIAIAKMDPVTKTKLIYPLGRIQSMEVDHKSRDNIRKGQANAGVAMRLDSGNMTNMPTWGRHIDESDTLYSLVSRKSIDLLKDPAFRDDVPREDWLLLKKLKTVFDIK